MVSEKEKIIDHNKSDSQKEQNNDLVFSYLTLRNLIGFAGMLLPIALAVFPKRPSAYYGFEPSISDYFYTDRGDILVVILCVLGTFLITYTGYTNKERALTFVAGVCGMAVAFVPTRKDCVECALSVHTGNGGVFVSIAGTAWHFAFAATFLFCLAIISLVYFTKSHPTGENTRLLGKQKEKRNIVFKICGWTIIGSLIIMGVYFIFKNKIVLNGFPIIYVFETVAVEAFAISWLTKGQTFWPDGEHYLTKGFKQVKSMLSTK